MLTIDPKEIATKDLHGYLLGAIGPRPIALASTVDANGNANLSPFSFFNVFSANPPIAIFSPARRVRNNTTKHTLENAITSREVVINIVNYNIVEQVSLSSTEYGEGVNEFVKSGLTPLDSENIAPFRVKESPVQMECIVKDVVALGEEGGAGNLVICEIVKIHINEAILDANGKIDPDKIDLVGRMGGDWYCRASGEAVFKVEKPLRKLGIGVDKIPQSIRNSYILTGNDLGKLGNVEKLPETEVVEAYMDNREIKDILDRCNDDEEQRVELHTHAHELLDQGKLDEAWKTLLIDRLNRL
ncbi:MAG: flavin reductase (DIM6/NTAB) family NADH-FMN oxidoreductase RutF [Flavobacteriales bacterium]|jgi:flavin reductase (DIM6/NTAB) family NADH-FMN oxidoreductase RutF